MKNDLSEVHFPQLINNDNMENYAIMEGISFVEESWTLMPKPGIINTEDEYDWTDINNGDYTTPVKNQNGCGSCWVFAATGVLESIIKIREGCSSFNPDLSEQYVLSCLPLSGSCLGGWAYRVFLYIMDISQDGNGCNGIIQESCFPYQTNDEISCYLKCDDWQDTLIPIKDHGFFIPDGSPTDWDRIKSQIRSTGPVTACMYVTEDFIRWGSTHHYKSDYYHNTSSNGGINHIIMIVGWKDDETIDNGGYWICKNSWGEEWGTNGFFNIEYGTLNIDNQFSMISWVDYDNTSFNWPPTAIIDGPLYGMVSKNITCSAESSFDPDRDDLTYIWDFGDGSTITGNIVNHSYQSYGTYTITLQVIDSNGQQSSTTAPASIQRFNRRPNKLQLLGPTIISTNIEHTFEIVASDPENGHLNYIINWGDDTENQCIGPVKSDEHIQVNHAWHDPGIYLITLYAEDMIGEQSRTETYCVFILNSRTTQWIQLFYKIIDEPILKDLET
jgi:hypothetical protein